MQTCRETQEKQTLSGDNIQLFWFLVSVFFYVVQVIALWKMLITEQISDKFIIMFILFWSLFTINTTNKYTLY